MNAMAKRVHHHDHTAHIRERLRNRAIYAATGFVVPILGYGVVRLLTGLPQSPDKGILTTMESGMRVALIAATGSSLLILIVTGFQWLNYRRNRST
jgi:hypothetical protein